MLVVLLIFKQFFTPAPTGSGSATLGLYSMYKFRTISRGTGVNRFHTYGREYKDFAQHAYCIAWEYIDFAQHAREFVDFTQHAFV